jgi:hypothetical protein
MKKIYLTFILVFGMFAQQGWAPPPGKGGAAAAPDLCVVGKSIGKALPPKPIQCVWSEDFPFSNKYDSPWNNDPNAKAKIKVESDGTCTNFGAVGQKIVVKNTSSKVIEFDVEISNNKNSYKETRYGLLNAGKTKVLTNCDVWPNSEGIQKFTWTILKARFTQ